MLVDVMFTAFCEAHYTVHCLSSESVCVYREVCVVLVSLTGVLNVQQAMEGSGVLPVEEARQTIDSRDHFALRMCSMLGV